MPDLATRWLGLTLRSPLVMGASPLTDDLEALRACCGAGAGAVVMRSLFEEQILHEQLGAHFYLDALADTDAEARTFLPETHVFGVGAEPYLARLQTLRDALPVPVIASLNGTTPGGWADYARAVADAGAAAIELNLYEVVTGAAESGAEVERRQLEVVRSVAGCVGIPVTVKLSPFYSSLPAFVRAAEEAGARGAALFNRFYQPDIDLDLLELSREIRLSTNAELPLRLHALAVLFGHTGLDLAVTGGVHSGDDAAKSILCGATAVQTVSAVLRGGAQAVRAILDGLRERLGRMGYVSLDEARGALSLRSAPNPREWERLNYARLLQGWEPARR